jgi:hypothetical protein
MQSAFIRTDNEALSVVAMPVGIHGCDAATPTGFAEIVGAQS